MALPAEKSVPLEQDSSADAFPDAMVDVDDIMADDADDDSVEASATASDRFTCSAELRRKIEERLELKMLKDELGFDESDI